MGFIHVSPDMTAGDLIVGAGTLALAAFTAWLAFRTSREVAVSEQQTRLTRESIEAQDRPFVVVARNSSLKGVGFYPELFYFGMANYGRGPAIVEDVQCLGPDGEALLPETLKSVRTIPAGGEVNQRMAFDKAQPQKGAELKLQIWYRSASGGRYLTESRLEAIENGKCRSRGHRRIDVTE